MKLSIETQALGLAVLAGAMSLGGALLIASPIQRMGYISQQQSVAPVASIELQAQLKTGALYFAMSCADCHGDDATGDEGPDLHHLAISNARIAATIHNGVKGEMPSFAKKYGDQDVKSLVAYLRSLP